MRVLAGAMLVVLSVGPASAQPPTPQPFPSPATGQPARPAQPSPTAKPPTSGTAAPAPAPAPSPDLGDIPLYPNAVYLTSYDAGRGQQFHLYGVLLPYADAVSYYRTALKQRGDELFQSPPTYQFEIGRFREQDMAFPPSVTVKDYTFGGSAGYVNPRGGTPERFPTVIQIVTLPGAR